jgi:hypothetical protein
MQTALKFEPPVREGSAAQRLIHTMGRYLNERQTESLLIFLDEADAFVEEQIRAYDEQRERCITWQMRTVIEARKDKMDLPRIRFVFSGYRVTHQADGAWANWGDVLRLNPLGPDEAASLIAGPLARLGIDASREAGAVAYRCGYQPAILIRFGQQLLDYLDTVIPAPRRESVVVLPEHVATVFSSQPVQQEIRTVVWNNFHGNRLGRIVFSALLLEFADLTPGGVVDDAAVRVLRRIREIVPDFAGFPPGDGASLDVVSRHLRDFVGRSLLIEADPTTSSFQFKFPHHLPVLLQEDQSTAIRLEARELSVGTAREQPQIRSMLGSAVIADLAYAVSASDPVGMEVAAAVVCSHWLEAIEHPTGGIADRLGFERELLIHAATTQPEARAGEPRIVLSAASPEASVRLLRARPRELPAPLLLGGVDLLRWAMRQPQEEERLLEFATVSRLAASQLQWWFERVRGVEFSGRSPLSEFLSRTSGIPFLVGLLDKLLIEQVGTDGATVSDRELEEVFTAFDGVFASHVKQLLSGPPAVCLLPRELEILQILCRASQDTTGRQAFVEAVTEDWDVLYGAELPLPALTNADTAALSVLQRVGLLPLRSDVNATLVFEHLLPLPRTDASFRIVEVLGT